jgi:hypothetical protein
MAQHVSNDTPLIIKSSKTVIAASGFTHGCGCRQLSWLRHDSCRQPQMYVKPEAAITVFELLMMSGMSLETCWAIKKHWHNKLYYTVASCSLFLYDLHYKLYPVSLPALPCSAAADGKSLITHYGFYNYAKPCFQFPTRNQRNLYVQDGTESSVVWQ